MRLLLPRKDLRAIIAVITFLLSATCAKLAWQIWRSAFPRPRYSVMPHDF